MQQKTSGTAMAIVLVACLLGSASTEAQGQLASFSFDSDPQWNGRFNQPPGPGPFITQNFGYSPTNHAGGSLIGELGGVITRSTTPAWVATEIDPLTFNDVLVAEGRLSLSPQNSSGWLHFGWFNDERQGWRPWSSMGFRLEGQGTHSRVQLDAMTQTWKGSGLPTTIIVPHDGNSHAWRMVYDPTGADDRGTLSFSLNDGPPVVHTLTAGHRFEGATFNRFGLWNGQTPGGTMTAYFDDIQHNGVTTTFDSPLFGWEQKGNQTTFRDQEQRPWHNFGYSNTNHAGGQSPGEIGGMIWRPPVSAEPYYAMPTEEPLTLDDYLYMAGKFALVRGSTDGGARFGWFNKESIENTVEVEPGQIARSANFLAINVEGPTHVGHYFRPHFALSDLTQRDPAFGPIIFPDGESHDFTFEYDPNANGGLGMITVTLDEQIMQWNLTAEDRAKGALFDHFGIFGLSPDGPFVEMYLDDLVFTTAIPEPATLGLLAAGGLMLLVRRGRKSVGSP